ncbi:hypothetical protein BRADI_2g45425v3 [Brachypodium distachyon]|uniref:Uncharacterized protein n=1 Tax=Brachypodium distachyon TaxID=15368 RepID=A0A2K2DE31_BRADI|nr:hypothetical protein BRADI_2g45425v3 [Brachypodium distachyon]
MISFAREAVAVCPVWFPVQRDVTCDFCGVSNSMCVFFAESVVARLGPSHVVGPSVDLGVLVP